METEEKVSNTAWEPNFEAFLEWLGDRRSVLEPGLQPQPTIKVLTFMALLDSNQAATYDDIKRMFRLKNVIKGNIPDNTLRTSILHLGKTLEKSGHPFELKSYRGLFRLVERKKIHLQQSMQAETVVVLSDPPAVKPEEVAYVLIEKAMMPLSGLFFLESSARWWTAYASQESEDRIEYEAGAWEQLGIRDRFLGTNKSNQLIGVVGLGTGEGLAEINLLKTILRDENLYIHYLAIDCSKKLLRDHIGLLKETFTPELENGRLICAGVEAVFSGLRDAVEKVKNEFKKREYAKSDWQFLPSTCSLLVTCFGNTLGNNYQDQETEFFTMIHNNFQNRPLEILTGVSVMRPTPDEYTKNYYDFLLQTPRYLLETRKLLESSRSSNSTELPEFVLPAKDSENYRCLSIKPEQYIVRHQIEGQIYRCYYKLAFDLDLTKTFDQISRPLPKGTLILMASIIKYKMNTLVNGIEMCGAFKVKYDPSYHKVVDTPNAKREYAVFSVYLER